MLGHEVAQRALQQARALVAAASPVGTAGPVCPARAAAQQRTHLFAGLGHGLGRTTHLREPRDVVGSVCAGDAPVDEQLDQRVAAKAIGAVQPRRCLADGVQPVDARAVILGANPNPTHRIVSCRRDLNGLLGDVEHLQVDHGAVDARQFLENHLARQVRHIEKDAAVRGAAAFDDLGVARECHAVAGRELHALGIVLGHVALTERVAQNAALAARRLAHEGAGRVGGLENARGVKLHELGVANLRPRERGEPERVAGILVAPR